MTLDKTESIAIEGSEDRVRSIVISRHADSRRSRTSSRRDTKFAQAHCLPEKSEGERLGGCHTGADRSPGRPSGKNCWTAVPWRGSAIMKKVGIMFRM
jgi:hypothetical protein